MTWDSDKSTAADPDNPAADEQVTADEWDNHVADQKSRVLYGPVADRPAAGDVPNGTVYLITDLANNGGVLTEVVSGAWEIKQIGDDANRPDIVGAAGDFNSVDTGGLSHNLEGGSDLSASRSLNTEYQNTTGRTVLVIVLLKVSASGEFFDARLLVNPSSGASFSGVQDYVKETADNTSATFGLKAIVPDGAYYMAESTTSNDATIFRWHERRYV